jgi:hypothetical protein
MMPTLGTCSAAVAPVSFGLEVSLTGKLALGTYEARHNGNVKPTSRK